MNVLPPGVSAEQVDDAVALSGYPLQTVLERTLRGPFTVTPEWSYVDRESGATRNMDLLAVKPLFDWAAPQQLISPLLALLIECKRATLPYIFFETARPLRLNIEIAGVYPRSTIQISADDDLSHWNESFATSLELSEEEFLSSGPAYASTFARINRAGNHLDLSGSDIFNNAVMPLIKASDYLIDINMPRPSHRYYHPQLVVRVCVVDAPMLIFRQASEHAEITDWVRVLRHEIPVAPGHFNDAEVRPIDFVHSDYLATYLSKFLMPFAERFAERAAAHQVELATGKGHVTHSRTLRELSGLHAELRPRPRSSSIRHSLPVAVPLWLLGEARSRLRGLVRRSER